MAAVVQTVFYYPQLPDIVASHFDGSGEPNGWSSKQVFFAIYFGALILTLAVFVVLPKWSANRQTTRINIPNTSYWFHPERREATLGFIKIQFLWLGVAHMLLALIIIQMVILTNLAERPVLGDGIYWVLGGYGLFIVLWLTCFAAKFLRKP